MIIVRPAQLKHYDQNVNNPWLEPVPWPERNQADAETVTNQIICAKSSLPAPK
jgi:hypothetical protein